MRSTFWFSVWQYSLFGTQVSFWILYICNISSQLSERTGQEGVDQPINALTRYPLALHLKTQVDQRWEMGYLCRLPFVWSQRRRRPVKASTPLVVLLKKNSWKTAATTVSSLAPVPWTMFHSWFRYIFLLMTTPLGDYSNCLPFQEIMDVEHLWFSTSSRSNEKDLDIPAVNHDHDHGVSSIPGGENMVQTLTNMADKRLFKLVKWCKSLPLFKNILVKPLPYTQC